MEEEKKLKVSVYLDRCFYEQAEEESVNLIKGTIRRSLAERNVEVNHFYTTTESGAVLIDLEEEEMPEDEDSEYLLTYPHPINAWDQGDVWEVAYFLDVPILPFLLFMRLTPEQWLSWTEAEGQLSAILESMWVKEDDGNDSTE